MENERTVNVDNGWSLTKKIHAPEVLLLCRFDKPLEQQDQGKYLKIMSLIVVAFLL